MEGKTRTRTAGSSRAGPELLTKQQAGPCYAPAAAEPLEGRKTLPRTTAGRDRTRDRSLGQRHEVRSPMGYPC